MRILMAALLAVTLFAGCGEQGFEPIPGPGLRAGDAFAYIFEEDESVTVDRFELTTPDGSTTKIPADVDRHAGPSLGATFLVVDDAYFEDAGYSGAPTETFAVAVTTGGPATLDDFHGGGVPPGLPFSDIIAIHPGNLNPARATFDDFGSEPAIRSFGSRAFGYEWIRFPLEQGDTWNESAISMFGDDVFLRGDTVVVTVGGMTTVDGPYGEVKAVRIHHEVVQYTDEEIEQKSKEFASESVVDRWESDVRATADAYFAPDLHNIVLIELNVEGSFVYEAHDDEVRIAMAASLSNHRTMRLYQHESSPMKPLRPSEIEQLMGVVPDLPLPEGIDKIPARLLIRSNTERVGAGETVSFDVTAPEGEDEAAVNTTVYGPDGFEAAFQGDFTLAPTQPGSYYAEAKALDKDGKAQRASQGFSLDFERVVQIKCDLVAPGMRCEDMKLEVPGNWMTASVSAVRASSPPQPMGAGTLTVSTAHGDLGSAQFVEGKAALELDDSTLIPDEWTLAFDNVVDAQVVIDVTITAEYFRGGAALAKV